MAQLSIRPHPSHHMEATLPGQAIPSLWSVTVCVPWAQLREHDWADGPGNELRHGVSWLPSPSYKPTPPSCALDSPLSPISTVISSCAPGKSCTVTAVPPATTINAPTQTPNTNQGDRKGAVGHQEETPQGWTPDQGYLHPVSS